MKKFLIVYFILFAYTTLLAEEEVPKVYNEYQTDIYYINGVDTRETIANDQADLLEEYIRHFMYNDSLEEMEKHIPIVKLLYNKSVSQVMDFLESISQKLDDFFIPPLSKQLLILSLLEILIDDTSTALTQTQHDIDLNKQIEAYKESIRFGHKVLTINYSQGNLFAYEGYNALDSWMQPYFEAVSIASPMFNSITPNTERISWENDAVAFVSSLTYDVIPNNVIRIYWEALDGDENTTLPEKPSGSYIYKSQLDDLYPQNANSDEQQYKPQESLFSHFTINSHCVFYYLGGYFRDIMTGKEIYNPYTGALMYDKTAKDKILNAIKTQLERLNQLDSQWKYDTNSTNHTIRLKHKFDDSIVLDENVYPFNIITGKVYRLADGNLTKASYGGTRIESEWEGQALNELYRLDNPEEEKILSDRFQFYSEDNLTIIDTKTYLLWDNSIHYDDWNDANSYCKNLMLDSYEDWRIPDFYELASIGNPLTDSHVYEEFFTALKTHPYGYWSSTTFTYYEQVWAWWGSYYTQVTDSLVLNYAYSSNIWIDTKYDMNLMCVQQL